MPSLRVLPSPNDVYENFLEKINILQNMISDTDTYFYINLESNMSVLNLSFVQKIKEKINEIKNLNEIFLFKFDLSDIDQIDEDSKDILPILQSYIQRLIIDVDVGINSVDNEATVGNEESL